MSDDLDDLKHAFSRATPSPQNVAPKIWRWPKKISKRAKDWRTRHVLYMTLQK